LIIIPAIDLKDGKCVRLAQGDFSRMTVYAENPAEIAVQWQAQGAERIHIVDLDGSLAGSPRNREVILNLVRAVRIPIEVGGGIRDIKTVDFYVSHGIRWIILGTAALKNEVFVKEACRVFRGHVMVGIDAKDGLAAIEGWTEKTSEPAVDVARRYEGYGLGAVIYTDIKRDGMETGINIEATRIFAEAIEIPVIASGGVAGIEDIKKVVEIETAGVMGIIVGKALYTGGLYLPEAIMMAKSKKDL
jgi:phosphoribosylformimino-5-aminoimidazole carboxamide ribotide isomerase